MSDDISAPKRPLLITIFAILELLAAIACIVLGIITLVGGAAVTLVDPDIATLGAMGAIGGAILLVVGIIYLILSIGMFKGWRVIWYLEVIFGILAVLISIADLVLAFNFASIIILIIVVALLYYMFRPNVKAFFKI